METLPTESLLPVPVEFDSLRDFITDLNSDYIRFYFPAGIDIKYNAELIRRYFERFDWQREYYNTSSDGFRYDGIVTTGYTVTCWFKDKNIMLKG